MRPLPSLAALAAALLLAACATGSAPPKSHITFMDSRIFDDELSDALDAGLDEVTVETGAGVTLGHIPERMDKWLYTVRDADRQVVAQPSQGTAYRSIGLAALLQAIATGTYGWLRDSITYSPARNYDATLIYDKASGKVERVVFRAVAPAQAATAESRP